MAPAKQKNNFQVSTAINMVTSLGGREAGLGINPKNACQRPEIYLVTFKRNMRYEHWHKSAFQTTVLCHPKVAEKQWWQKESIKGIIRSKIGPLVKRRRGRSNRISKSNGMTQIYIALITSTQALIWKYIQAAKEPRTAGTGKRQQRLEEIWVGQRKKGQMIWQ